MGSKGQIATCLALGALCVAACGDDIGGGSGGTGGSSGATGGVAGSGIGGSAGSGSGGTAGTAGSPAAGAAGAAGTGTAGQAGTAGAAGAQPDASTDSSDAGEDAPVSAYCGDGIRDPVTEECDDGNASSADSCTASCQVQDVLLVPGPGSDGGVPPKVARRLGEGRHAVGGGDSGFAIALVTSLPQPLSVGLKPFDAKGVPGPLLEVAADSSITATANPVVAALPGGKYAVAYTDLNADGDGLGVVMRIVDPASNQVGSLVRVNATKSFGQHDADLIWTGTELVVAWVDDSKVPTSGSDLKLRTFGATGAPTSGETALATAPTSESAVALSLFAGSWAAAWRVAESSGETIMVKSSAASWSVSLTEPGPAGDKPALAELDSSRLLLVFTKGGAAGTTPRLEAAILDASAPGATASFAIAPLVAPYSTDSTLGQTQPTAVRAGSRTYVAWRSALVTGSANAEELWLKEVVWAQSALSLDLSKSEIPLPRWGIHLKDDQRRPALAATSLFPEGALAAAWDDYGRVFGDVEGTPDVVAELIPVPVVRLKSPPGGGQ